MGEISFSQGTAKDVVDGLTQSGNAPRDSQFIADATDSDLVMVASLDDAVVGYLAATIDMRGGLVVWEHVVLKEFRDRGIGRRLLLEAARRTPPMAQITIDPTGDFGIENVASYYSRLGFPSAPDDRFKVNVAAHKIVDKIGEQDEEDATIEAILRHKTLTLVSIAPESPIADAITLLHENHIGSVVVSHDGTTLAGMLSERDILAGLATNGPAMLEGVVSDYMTTDVVTINTTDVIADVMELATVKRLRHIPVSKAGSLVGLVSVGDLLVFRMREHDMRRDRLPYRA